MKLLLWAVIIFAVIWILRSKKSSSSVNTNADSAAPPPQPDNRKAEAMLRCTHCSTYFPASEAVFDSADTPFCSDQHRRQHTAH